MFGHEEEDEDYVAPVDCKVHPVLVALKLELGDFDIEVVFSEELLEGGVELIAGLEANALDFGASGLGGYGFAIGSDSAWDGEGLLIGVDELLEE